MSAQRFPYGGQAVLEGVMMRGRHQATVAVRAPGGEVVYKHEHLDVRRRNAWENLPFLRGILLLWDTLGLGTRALMFSASVASGEEEPLSKQGVVGTVALSLSLVIGLFFVLPFLLSSLVERFGAPLLVRELSDGLLRLLIFVGYLVAISRLPDIQRVFGYHGAEHKAVNAYEAGAPLTVPSVRSFTLIHPRCGTSFLLVVVLLGIVVFALVGGMPFYVRLLARVLFVPLIAALAYELLRLSAANYHRPWVRVLVAPSLAFQRLTTREPDDSMIEVAIAALLPVLAADGVAVAHAQLDTVEGKGQGIGDREQARGEGVSKPVAY
jgi:uncharacterized protein YqhQ